MQKNNQKIPEGWSVKKLKEVAQVITGSTPSTSDINNYGNDYLFVSPVDINSNIKYIIQTNTKLSLKGFNQCRVIRSGSPLFVCIGSTIGKIAIAGTDLVTNQQINSCVIKNGFNNEFLYYQLSSQAQKIRLLAGEQAVPIINKSTFEKIKLLFPPLAEQEKIAGILGTWDEAIEKLSNLIEQKKLLKKGLMQKLLTGKTRLYKPSPLAGEGDTIVSGEGATSLAPCEKGTEGEGLNKTTSHRQYAPYIKEFSRQMRKNPTIAENKLWQKIRNNQIGYKFRRQHQIDNKYIADFVCLEKRLIIELDGGQHADNIKDIERTTYLEKCDFRVIRFWDNEILNNIDGCLEKILEELKYTPHPNPLPQGARESKEKFTQPWKEVKLSDFLKEHTEKTTENDQYQVLSVTKNGICSQEEYFEKQIASENNIGYKILRKHDIVFSPMNLWMGSIGFSEYDIGIVSPAYKIFTVNENVALFSFLKHFMIINRMIYLYLINSEQGASIVRRNLDLDGLLSSKVSIPDIAEQQAIADVLSTADDEINLLNQKLEALKEQKKGLMQRLLTGQIRVKVN